MTRSPNPRSEGKDPMRQLVEGCFRREAGNSVAIPGDDVDLIGNGILDSMAWVSFLRTVESASGAGELGSGLNDRTASFSAVLAALKESSSPAPEVSPSRPEHTVSKNRVPAIIAGASAAVGSRVPASNRSPMPPKERTN